MRVKAVVDSMRFTLPLRGVVAAGWPSPAEEELGDLLSFDEWLLPHKESSVLLKVDNDVMREAGILPGDVVILERGRKPSLGSIVVAEVEGEWVMRHFGREDDKLVLRAANPAYALLQPENFKVIGVVRAVLRRYD